MTITKMQVRYSKRIRLYIGQVKKDFDKEDILLNMTKTYTCLMYNVLELFLIIIY